MRSTSANKSCTALMSCSSAGPDANRSGLIISGFIGLVELGSISGSQFAAGKSYQGEVASPCMVGMRKGASLDGLVLAFVVPLAALSVAGTES